MYKRDFGVLLVAAFGIYFCLQNEGTFSFRKAWYHRLIDVPALLYETDVLPQPVVIDLNGDGSLEVIAATHDCRIQVLKPRGVGREGDGFAKAQIMAEQSLLPDRVHIVSGRRAVALSAGFIDPGLSEFVRTPRKGVIVVVTADSHVICFDHNLKVLWETQLVEDVPHHATLQEVAIHISNHSIEEGDRGLVVVGGSMHLGETFANTAKGSAAAGEKEEDVFEAELEAEKQEREHMGELGEALTLDDIDDAEGDTAGVDLSRHFSYHAYEASKGRLRWKHEGTDFHRGMQQLADQMIPQHNYRLTAESLVGRHFSEVSCRDYRESVLRVLPHQWSWRGDTRLELAHFAHHRSGKGEKKKELGAGTGGAAVKGRAATDPVSHTIASVASKAVSGGRSSSTTGVQGGQKWLPPNVLVAHLREGIEAVHIASGRTICKLHLPEGGLHADLNGDGVLDHIQATGSHGPEEQGDAGHRHVSHCWAVATSGIPPQQPLFNGSICPGKAGAVWQPKPRQKAIQVGPPAILPVPSSTGHYRHGHRQRSYALFHNSRGELTALNANGNKQWQVSAGTDWNPSKGMAWIAPKAVPTLIAFPLRTHAIPTSILVAGGRTAAVYSERGHKLDGFDFPVPPVSPLQVVDFNGDGLNDIILCARNGYYGYAQVRHPGALPFKMLVMCLIVAMGVVYQTQHLSAAKGGQRTKRSTDRVD
eukprot:evm.model.scf_113.4 EVM.evm.TU.scf_113.4   scf_113:72029-79810(+)